MTKSYNQLYTRLVAGNDFIDFQRKETIIIDNKKTKKTNNGILEADPLQGLADAFVRDIKRYLELGGDRKNLRASNVYRFLLMREKDKGAIDECRLPTRIRLMVRSDENETRI